MDTVCLSQNLVPLVAGCGETAGCWEASCSGLQTQAVLPCCRALAMWGPGQHSCTRRVAAASLQSQVACTATCTELFVSRYCLRALIHSAARPSQLCGSVLTSACLLNKHADFACMAADAYGAVRNDKGLDIPALRKHLTEGGKLQDFPGGEQYSHGRWLQ